MGFAGVAGSESERERESEPEARGRGRLRGVNAGFDRGFRGAHTKIPMWKPPPPPSLRQATPGLTDTSNYQRAKISPFMFFVVVIIS